MYQYNAARIKKAIKERKRIAKACRDCARKYSPVPLPDSVIHRIHTRRKLYNFLEAFELNITALFWEFDLPVPRDHSLKQTILKEEVKPSWLNQCNQETEYF
jgi:hypothetical protein